MRALVVAVAVVVLCLMAASWLSDLQRQAEVFKVRADVVHLL